MVRTLAKMYPNLCKRCTTYIEYICGNSNPWHKRYKYSQTSIKEGDIGGYSELQYHIIFQYLSHSVFMLYETHLFM